MTLWMQVLFIALLDCAGVISVSIFSVDYVIVGFGIGGLSCAA